MPALSIMATNDKHELVEFESDGQNDRRLAEELNILKLEGHLFDFNPKSARKRTGRVDAIDASDHPVVIEPNPNYGMPSVLAYRILQAVFQRMTEEGYPYPDVVSFGMRELHRMCGRTSWGGKDAKELYHAVRQLRTTTMHCLLYDKELKEYEVTEFNPFSASRFVIDESKQYKFCMIEVDRRIVKSINRRHVAFFNLNRLSSLDVIGMVIYKRLFYHFSNTYNHRKMNRTDLSFAKDYEDICRDWLGGLKPRNKKVLIIRDQLGRHLEAVRRTGLIAGQVKDMVQKKADGSGFKLVFRPGPAFFTDYENYYLDRQQQQLRFKQTAAVIDIQQPIEIVGHFHERLGHQQHTYDEKETAYAGQLLDRHGVQGSRDLVEYAVERMRETRFDPRSFTALSKYRDAWLADQERRHEFERRQAAIQDCPHCDDRGMLYVKNRTGAMAARVCPHDKAAISGFEDAENLRMV